MENLFKRFLSLALAVLMVISVMPTTAFAAEGEQGADVTPTETTAVTETTAATEAQDDADAVAPVAEGNVAKVGNTEYATIDEAIAAWTDGTTLTQIGRASCRERV